MKLLEHEAKNILKQAGLTIPKGRLIEPNSTVELTTPIVLKSQVPIGGRGKLGGVVVVNNQALVASTISQLFALNIKGFTPKTLLAEELIQIKKEHYISLIVDRTTESIQIIARTSGGVDVEAANETTFVSSITPSNVDAVSDSVAKHLGLPSTVTAPFVRSLLTLFTKNDMTLLEINPLIVTTTDQLVCADCKIELDDAAAFRHPEWQFEDIAKDVNFVTLDKQGNVATIANGAGLAMATVDAVKAKQMTPANFLDIGGGANADSVLRAFQKINDFPATKAIVVNIFAGITRCDEVAKAIISAKQQITSLPPLYIRLAGTHHKEAAELLAMHDIPILETLDACLDAAKETVYA